MNAEFLSRFFYRAVSVDGDLYLAVSVNADIYTAYGSSEVADRCTAVDVYANHTVLVAWWMPFILQFP